MCDIYILGELNRGEFPELPPGLSLSVEAELREDSDDVCDANWVLRMNSCERSMTCRSDDVYIWNYPIDAHFEVKSAERMVRLYVKLVSQDGTTLAIGCCAILPRPGRSHYTCRLRGTTLTREQKLLMTFLGDTTRISEVSNFRVPCGYVELELNIITRGFQTNKLMT